MHTPFRVSQQLYRIVEEARFKAFVTTWIADPSFLSVEWLVFNDDDVYSTLLGDQIVSRARL